LSATSCLSSAESLPRCKTNQNLNSRNSKVQISTAM